MDSPIKIIKLISKVLRAFLGRRRAKSVQMNSLVTYMPSTGAAGVFPGVDLDDTAALLDLMEPPEIIARRYRT